MKWFLFIAGVVCMNIGSLGLFRDCKSWKKLVMYTILGFGGLVAAMFVALYFNLG